VPLPRRMRADGRFKFLKPLLLGSQVTRTSTITATHVPYGVASGVWSENIGRCMRMMRAINAGVVWVSTYRVAAPQAPFGGMKDSGLGQVRGEAGIREFTQTKNVFFDFSGDKRDPFSMKF
jgi:hypothetical protein